MENETNTIIETAEETETTETETTTEETQTATETETDMTVETECATSDSETCESITTDSGNDGTTTEQTIETSGNPSTSDILSTVDSSSIEELLVEQNTLIQEQTTVIDNGFSMLAFIILGIWVIKSVKSSVQKATKKEVPYKREGKK